MSELKSVNIASWGFAIIALFLIMIGLEEVCLFIPDGNWYDWYIPGGELAFIAMIFSVVLMVYSFWSGDKKNGVLFGWLSFMSFGVSIVAMKYTYPLLEILFNHLGILLGRPALAVGLVLAIFTLIFAYWAFSNEDVGKFYGVFFILMAVFVFLESLGSFFITTNDLKWETILYIIPVSSIVMPDATLIVKGFAGIFALLAGGLGMYIGLVRGVFNAEKEPKDQPLTTFDVRGLCGLILAFVLVMFGIELVLERIDFASGFGWNWENYSDLPALFVFVGIVMSVLMVFFAYWNGDKKNALFVFAILMFFSIISLFYSNSAYSIAGAVFGEDMNAFFVPALMFALFMFCMSYWYYAKAKKSRLYGTTILLLAIALFVIGTIQFAGDNYEWVYNIQMLAGLLTIASGIATLFIGFANSNMGKVKMV